MKKYIRKAALKKICAKSLGMKKVSYVGSLLPAWIFSNLLKVKGHDPEDPSGLALDERTPSQEVEALMAVHKFMTIYMAEEALGPIASGYYVGDSLVKEEYTVAGIEALIAGVPLIPSSVARRILRFVLPRKWRSVEDLTSELHEMANRNQHGLQAGDADKAEKIIEELNRRSEFLIDNRGQIKELQQRAISGPERKLLPGPKNYTSQSMDVGELKRLHPEIEIPAPLSKDGSRYKWQEVGRVAVGDRASIIQRQKKLDRHNDDIHITRSGPNLRLFSDQQTYQIDPDHFKQVTGIHPSAVNLEGSKARSIEGAVLHISHPMQREMTRLNNEIAHHNRSTARMKSYNHDLKETLLLKDNPFDRKPVSDHLLVEYSEFPRKPSTISIDQVEELIEKNNNHLSKVQEEISRAEAKISKIEEEIETISNYVNKSNGRKRGDMASFRTDLETGTFDMGNLPAIFNQELKGEKMIIKIADPKVYRNQEIRFKLNEAMKDASSFHKNNPFGDHVLYDTKRNVLITTYPRLPIGSLEPDQVYLLKEIADINHYNSHGATRADQTINHLIF